MRYFHFARKLGPAVWSLIAGIAMWGGTVYANAPVLDAPFNEQIIMVPATSGDESVQLETTIFRPPGAGPFPLLIMNHGKALGDPHQQERDRTRMAGGDEIDHPDQPAARIDWVFGLAGSAKSRPWVALSHGSAYAETTMRTTA